jgi:hypothetical protein
MLKRVVLIIAVLALIAAAGTVVKPSVYQITLFKATTVNGNVLKPGDYKLVVFAAKVTITPAEGGKTVESPITIETVPAKFDSTSITYNAVNNANVMKEIDLGGSKNKVIFAQ